jgi:hypothetical protein
MGAQWRKYDMKNRLPVWFGALVAFAFLWPQVNGQVSSPRRLTQRIAPLLPPQPANPPRPTAPPAAPGTTQPAASPTSPAGTRDVTNSSAQEARPTSPQDTDLVNKEAEQQVLKNAPLQVTCAPVRTDPDRSLQFLTLSLTNASAKAISHVTLHLTYNDASGAILKDWTTRREIEPPLPAGNTMDLNQPAYFMPFVAKRAEVKVLRIRFTDGTEWPPGT